MPAEEAVRASADHAEELIVTKPFDIRLRVRDIAP
ncbi:hypothetical protein SAMN04489832_5458 [Micromonospora cremea]|uniref:Uncharacterized protein n=1 Tax=Micromonospora cremea TaxID=709881 RepID=A0A1N6AFX3_9ACTN|nr:hypothetical protein SAMN04489832_5458 [Micromonospora cremea]